VTLAAERRARLLDWAARTRSFVLEDDYDGDFRYEDSPLPAPAALDHRGCVLYLGTFSKSLAPGLRLGHLVVPPGLRAAARAWKALSSIASPWLEQAAMAEFMRSGAFERHVRRIRRAYRARRDRLIAGLEQQLGPLEISGRRGGMHLAWRLPRARRRPSGSNVGRSRPGSGSTACVRPGPGRAPAIRVSSTPSCSATRRSPNRRSTARSNGWGVS